MRKTAASMENRDGSIEGGVAGSVGRLMAMPTAALLDPRKKTSSGAMAAELEKIAFLQGDPQAMQVAQQRMSEIWVQLMTMYVLYWDGHWKSFGPQQNADHALFAKLYGDTVAPLDDIAEKIHGYFGNQGFNIGQLMSNVAQSLAQLMASGEDHVHMGMTAEDQLQALLKQSHAELTQLGILPLGLDDWLMATASDFETHSYLLQQRAAGAPESVPVGEVMKTANILGMFMGKTAPKASEQAGKLMETVRDIVPKKTSLESAQDQLKLMKARKAQGLPIMKTAALNAYLDKFKKVRQIGKV